MAAILYRKPSSSSNGNSLTGIVPQTAVAIALDAAGIFPGSGNLMFEGQTLRSHDSRKVLIAGEVVPLDVYIEPGDVLTFEGVDWSVFDVKRLDPTGTNAVILWTVFCKR